MEIGEKVRFLNEVGGGRIAGFEGKDIVLVEDEDGFEIPMLRSQVVVIETNDNNFVRKPKKPSPAVTQATQRAAAHEGASLRAALAAGLDAEEPESDPTDGDITFRPKPKERRGGELLNLHIAFVEDVGHRADGVRFDTYLINDSNYYVSALYAYSENAAWHAVWQGTVVPNTKVRIHTFDRTELQQLEHLSVSFFAWKDDKPFVQKPAATVELRLQTVKFYKLHVFADTPFFHSPALLYQIVRDDKPLGLKAPMLASEEETPLSAPEETSAALTADPTSPASPSEDHKGASPRSDREAVKAAKRALKQEQEAMRKKHEATPHERDPHVSKPNHRPEQDGILEVDLHINALLDNTNGLSPAVMLNTQLTEFRIVMDRNIKRKGQRIVFIHGKGEGVLREAIIKELRHRYRTCTYEDASFQQYGFGATMVTIR